MADTQSLSPEFFDKKTDSPPGYRDKRGEWRPASPVTYAPVFRRGRVMDVLRWLRDYLFKWNLLYVGITLLTWYYLQPSVETCRTFRVGWISQMFLRNMVLLWLIFGGWHLYLYTLKKRGYKGKYTPRWQSTDGATFLFKNQVYDNVFWSCTSGCITWTAYEVVTMWMYANGHMPFAIQSPKESPLLFTAILLFIPIWREFHFYWIHRLIHWKPLYDRIHYLHHYNINVGPWSGMAMHPIEHILYFSVTLIHWVIPFHPIHFFFTAQHTALTPAHGHTGFEGNVMPGFGFGSYFHYLHHRHFNCNYGESTIPLDHWFGTFDDGAQTDTERSESKRSFHGYKVIRVEDESFEVKSLYLTRTDGEPLDPYLPGQHLMFKVPLSDDETVSRLYTLSDVYNPDYYRISVKKEVAPEDQPGLPNGSASCYLHEHAKVGDCLEARGPIGDFTPDPHSGRPLTLVGGGIGITPILAILKGVIKYHPNKKLHLFLAFKTTKYQLFKTEIDEILKRHPRIVCHTFFDEMDEDGIAGLPNTHSRRVDVELIESVLPDLNQNFYICGSMPMMTALVDGLKERGVSEGYIHTEMFTHSHQTDVQPLDAEQHDVHFTRSGKTFLWDGEFTNLLEFAESNGIPMQAGCMFGSCGACSVEVEDGEVEYNYPTARQPKEGHCLACSCHPKSELRINA